MTEIKPSSEQGSRPPPSKSHKKLPARFYTHVRVVQGDGAHRVLLDDRPLKTPKRTLLTVPSQKLADAIMAEWAGQGDKIDPETMPLTKLANTAIDGVSRSQAAVEAAIAQYIESDALCYRAQNPAELKSIQDAAWNPILRRAEDELGLTLIQTDTIMPITQPGATIKKAAAIVSQIGASECGTLKLAALHVLTTLTGSLILGLTLARGRLSADEAWTAAHIDEDFQISRWGEDEQATKRRALRRKEFNAAHRLLGLLG